MPRLALCPALLATLVGLAAEGRCQGTSNNVLILVADDLGAENVAVYGVGATPPPTPNIDALAQRGVLFRNFWSNPVCSPTRACFHTGRYSFRTGVGNANLSAGGVLRFAETTLPEHLDAAGSGRAHAAFGKWHLSDQRNGGALGPNLAGWSFFAGTQYGVGASYFSWPRTVNGVTATMTSYNTTQTVDDALAWIGGASTPWVCMVSFNAPHAPYHEPPAHLHSYAAQLQGKTPETDPIPFYKATVEAMDREIGRLLQGLGTALATTDVIFLSDNGTPAEIAEPPLTSARVKGSPYEGGIRVPLIVAGPSVQSPGREEQALVHAVDLFATVAELCGVTSAPVMVAFDSVSLVPHLTSSGVASRRQSMLAEYFVGTYPNNGFAALRDDVVKLIHHNSWGGEEIYDLVQDPLEQNNLVLSVPPALQTRVDRLRNELANLHNFNGWFESYGAPSCAGSNGNPVIAGVGVPTIGLGYAVSITNAPPFGIAALLFGISSTQWLSLPLPLPLSVIGGAPGCHIYSSGEMLLSVPTSPSGIAYAAINLPNEPVLTGGALYHTWLVADRAAPNNPLGITTSDGLMAIIGQPIVNP